MESPKLQVAICGAGIAGLSLAISIQRRCPNIKCTLYEARSNYGEIGAGVGFGPNSVTAMYLIDPAIKAGYDKIRTRNGIPEKENVWYDFRWGQGSEENKLIGVVKSEEGYTHGNCSRSQFLDELVKLVAPGSAVFDKKIVGIIDDKEKGKTILSFQDGTHVEADAVIGCDGVKSNCRKILLGPSSIEATPTFSGKFAYRKVVDMKKAISVAGEDVKNRQMYLGQGGHVLTFPIRHGQMLNIVAFTTQTDGVWNDRQWVLPSTTESMQQQFSGWGSQVSKVLSLIDAPEKWALFDHLPATTYYRGNFCIMGDAAHASTPHFGAGAGMAIEDAYVLGELLSCVTDSSEIEQAFRAYDAARRPRTQKLVRESRKQGILLDLEDQEVLSDALKLRHALDTNPRWVWNVDLEATMREFKDHFRSLIDGIKEPAV